MAREEGTYMLMVDVFNGQRVLCFPLSYYDGEAYLLGLDDDYCAPFGQPISNFGLLDEEEIAEEIAKTSPEYSVEKETYWGNYRLKCFKLDYGKCYHSIYRPVFYILHTLMLVSQFQMIFLQQDCMKIFPLLAIRTIQINYDN